MRYDYECQNPKCREIHEISMSMRSDGSAPVPCPSCGAPSRRLITGGAGFASASLARDRKFSSVVSESLPSYVETEQRGPDGQPVFHSRREAREIAKRYGFVYDQ